MIHIYKTEAAFYVVVAFVFGIFAGVFMAAIARAYL